MDNSQRFHGICLMGPTATGKTDFAIQLSQKFPIQIISVDSALIYRDMDIGTAKPDIATLNLSPHELVNIRDPDESYSAAEFCNDAELAVRLSLSQKKIPLLVGGTMMYFHSLIEGMSRLPAANLAIRERLRKEIEAGNLNTLHARLTQVDPISAKQIHANDPQRIQRALEVFEITGVPLSTLQQTDKIQQPLNFLQIALMPTDRTILHERIASRFSAMLEAGLLEELIQLKTQYSLSATMPSMRCVGYRQAWQFLNGQITQDALTEKGIVATRQLAKRQMTWIRNRTNTLTIPVDITRPEKVLDLLCCQLQNCLKWIDFAAE